jgi:hypothetical protein
LAWSRFRPYLVTLALLAFSTGCGSTTDEQLTGPDPVRCAIALSPATANVGFAANQLSLVVTAGRECDWSARSQAGWAQASPASGQGDATLTVAIAANTQQSARTTSLSINDAVLEIAQAAAPAPPPPCTFNLSPGSRTVNDDPGTATVSIQTGSTCTWTAVSSVTWLTLNTTGGTGPATLSYSFTRNFSPQSRSGNITIGGEVHRVIQRGR